MDAYMKLPKDLLKMNLSLKELGLIVKLLYIEDYREYKNETNDGWFIKSKRELANELKTDVRRLNPIIDSLIEKGLVECEVVPDKYTMFKINRSQNDITNRSQNDIGNRSQNDITNRSQNCTLHNNNINNNNNNNNNNNKTILSSTSNIYNLKNNIENNNINNKNIIKENMFENNEKEVISSTSTSSNNSDERDNIQPLVGESSNKTGEDSLNYYNEIKASNPTAITESLIFQVMENCKSLANTNRDNWDNQDKELYDNSIVQYKNKYGYNFDTARTAIDNMINSYIPSEL